MKFRTRLTALLIPLLLSAPLAHAAAAANAGRSCHLPGTDEAMRCIKVPVPVDYARPDGAKMDIHVTLAPAFRESARPDPLFILAGGPGQAGSDLLDMVENTFRRVRATRDIVFIDQRGTGLSGKLDCPSKPEHETMNDDQLDAEIRNCIAALGKPYAAYTSANAARDLEQVRRALGYGKVNIWGGSYGTRLGQAYARAFPGAVRALVLDGVAAPDQVIPVGGRDGQAALDGLFKACARDASCNQAFPALRAEFDALVARLGAGPIEVSVADPRTTRPLKTQMTRDRFLGTVHSVLYSPLDSRRLPFLIHSASQGRWAPFIARRNVMGDFAVDGPMALVLHMAVICAEDYPRVTPAMAEEDARASQLTAHLLNRLQDVCKAVGAPAVPYAAPTRIDAPVLMLSGALDPVTPPRRAEAAGKHMAKARHVVVSNAGHGISPLGCAPRLLRAFIDQPDQKLDATCLAEIPAPTFQVGSAGPHP
ncbi:alpha/beta fold hydrolase [Massilia cavernae]|uniref:alpha/beta fold hydrolase n=1 Tax=Massilia cavernae TaxID=2320864 RepID=UPI001E48696A|nr:alpha/beta fold hydrolase [Massilia cavernae]